MGNNYFFRASKWAESKAKDVTTSAKSSALKKNSRKKRDRSAQPGNAPLKNTLKKAAETVSEEPPVARACPSEANADSNSSTQDNQLPTTMKPIGEYPSLAEYKSVGLKPPPRHVIEQAKLSARTDEDGDDLMTDTPITPVADEIMDDQITCVDQQNDKFTDGYGSGSFTTSMEGEVAEKMGLEVNVQVNEGEDGMDKSNLNPNLASPISQSLPPPLLAPSSFHTSSHTSPSRTSSPFHTPVGTPVEEVTDPIMAPSKRTKKKTPAPAAGRALQHPQSPSATAETPTETPAQNTVESAVASTVPPTAEIVTPVGDDDSRPDHDYVAVLNRVPQPASKDYDVPRLRRLLEYAISRPESPGEDEIAVALLFYWYELHDMDSSSRDYRLSLLDNLLHEKGMDHEKTTCITVEIRRKGRAAQAWYKSFNESDARAPTLNEINDEPEEPTPQPNPDQPKIKLRLKLRNYYRDTSGSKLEEAFLTGKTNTAPNKRPKKPCPANEEALKRRTEWDEDQDHENTVRTKRARLQEAQPDDSLSVSVSDLRAHRQEVEIPQPDLPSDPDVVMSTDPDVPEARSRRQERVLKPALKATSKLQPKGKGKKNNTPLSKAKLEANIIHNRKRFEAPTHVRSFSPPRDTSTWAALSDDSDDDLSNSIYSKCSSGTWDTSVAGSRHAPDEMERGLDNDDECSLCEEGGELICCETCLNAFHRNCVDSLALIGVDNDEWFCPDCDSRHPFTTGIFKTRDGNQTEFALAQEYRAYFKGVEQQIAYRDTTGPQWSLNTRAYKEVPDIPRLTKPPKKNGKEIDYLPYNDESLLKLTDNGHVLLCSGCSRSSDNSRPIIKCDYCPRRYHLDCLDPPLAHPPNPKKGWMCPRHKNPESEVLYKEGQDGGLMERRRREAKDPSGNDAGWEDGWRTVSESTQAGAVVWDFISHAKADHHLRKEESIKRHYFDIASSAVEDLAQQLSHDGFQMPEGWMENFRSSLESAPRQERSGKVVQEADAEAADALLSLAASG